MQSIKANSTLFFLLILFVSCNEFNSKNGIDKIPTVTIGNQIWMKANLDVVVFRNGDTIPEIQNADDWIRAGENEQPAWCYYDNNSSNDIRDGKLYNWYAVNDPRGLAPNGWHVPSDNEWDSLISFLGGIEIAGKKLKSTTGWYFYKDYSNEVGTNEVGFDGFPGGSRSCSSDMLGTGFGSRDGCGTWWSATKQKTREVMATDISGRSFSVTPAKSFSLYHYNSSVVIRNDARCFGYSVRCIKD